jgi:cobalt/nickel transport system permease protein
MQSIESSLKELLFLDDLSYQDTSVHRLDPRSKIIVTFVFVLSVVSFNRFEIVSLIPYVLYLMFMMGVGRLPVRFFLKRLLVLAPFVIFIGIFNPLFDKRVMVRIGSFGITGGWISFTAILIRYCLTVSAALILIACTGFNALCYGLESMMVPRIFVVQLLLLYRYIFVLTDEVSRMARARSLRTLKGGSIHIKLFVSLVGALLVRTMERAQRIYSAMRARGFDGTIRLTGSLKFRTQDVLFISFWVALFALFRLVNVPLLLGTQFLRISPWLK